MLLKGITLLSIAAVVVAQNNYPNQYGNTQQYGNQQQTSSPFNSNQPGSQFNSNQPGSQFNSNQPGSQFNSNQPNNQFNGNQQYGSQQFGNPNQQFGGQQFGNQPDDSNCCEEYCYVTDEEPYIQFATKTSYDSLSIRNSNQHVIPDCTPVQFWSIIRQGTNYPESHRINALRNLGRLHDEVVKNHEERRSYPDRGRLCTQDYDLIKRWHWNESITPEKANSLSPQGIEDLKLLARRYKSKYAQILQNYDERTYSFQYTNLDKAHDSYQAYIEGLFGSESYRVHANIANDDMLTRPYENCPQYSQIEQTSYMTNREAEHFREKHDYAQMVKDVFRRLGFKYSLNASVINDIYDLCRYEKAWNVGQRSAWCTAFNKNQLKLLEYAEDLQNYYENGYGNQNSKRIGCGPLRDLYDKFDKTANGLSNENKGTFHFTHSAAFQAFLTALGVAKDFQAITADNYFQQSRRMWKTSVLDPFSANLVAALYQCRGAEKYKVMFFLNEVPVEFPECSVGLCDWSSFKQKFERAVRDCDVNALCNKAPSIHSSYLITLLSVILYFRLQ